MDTQFFQKGQRVRIEADEGSHWEATAVVNEFEYDPQGKIRFSFTNWQQTMGGTNFDNGGTAELWYKCASCIFIAVGFGNARYVSRSGESFQVTVIE